ncbi:hypothetical protein [Pseudomonas nitroreducens]|uniref:hypothetical protein n=1 Tax=Pseudomonas nitroreducens TaxID=46680 RepID=UPI002D7E913D|nr:hypothetical protein [Pseudomonas nitroreducens]
MAKPSKTPGRNGYAYKPRFGVIVVCPDEQAQQDTYQRLKAQGYKLRVVCV